METIKGSVYYLQNPLTKEVFYVGATKLDLKVRLTQHYIHLREVEKGLRRMNKRYKYLQELLPTKATIHLLSSVSTTSELEKQEIDFIRVYRRIYPNLTNMTDGGRGKCTSKYYTESEMEEYSAKISNANKGRKKPDGFAEHMSITRQGINNPGAKPYNRAIVCMDCDDEVVAIFHHAFEIDRFIGKKQASSNVKAYIKRGGGLCYGYKWQYED